MIWTTSVYRKNFKQAAEEFARTYWGEPRKVVGMKERDDASFTFKVTDGAATYALAVEELSGHGRVYVVDRLEV